MATVEASPLERVKADLAVYLEMIEQADAGKLDLKRELTQNLLPMIGGLVDAINVEVQDIADEVADQGEQIDQIEAGISEFLLPESAAKIAGFVELSRAVTDELEQLLPKADDLTKKKLRMLIKNQRQGAEIIKMLVTELVAPDDDDRDDPDETATDAPAPTDDTDDDQEEG